MAINIVKYLQSQGIGSKKTCLDLLHRRQVRINNQLQVSVQLLVEPKEIESLTIGKKKVVLVPLPYFYIALNKPADMEVTHQAKLYPSVYALFPEQLQMLNLQGIGRLDVDTTGLLLLTNDGQFNHQLTSPKHNIEKEYKIELKHPFTSTLAGNLLEGVMLHNENEKTYAKSIKQLDEFHVLMVITSGKYHQVKRMIAAAGNRVISLHRIRFGMYNLDSSFKPGDWEFIHPNQINPINHHL